MPQQACTSSTWHHTREHHESGCEHQGGAQDLATHHHTTVGCFSKLIHTGRWKVEEGKDTCRNTNLLPLFSIHTHPPPSPLSSRSFPPLSFFPTLHSYLFLFFFLFFSLRTLVTIQNPSTQYRLQRAKLSHNLSLTFFCRRRTPFSVITRTSLS